jgi:hypothetical protein
MPALLKHINQVLPTHVPVIIGAEEELVQKRELRNTYHTNRDIKSWACWFLLKALTKSGKIQQWTKQEEHLLHYTQMNLKTFYTRLHEMTTLQLITIEDSDIHLISYEKAAELLDITYYGTKLVEYDPEKQKGKQVFQYLIRGEEFKAAKERQFDGMHFKLDKNPPLKNTLHVLLVKAGADDQRLYKDRHYFQERLLNLQQQLFKEGSDIQDQVFERRADINRSVASIQKAHSYKAKQSVCYIKHRMLELGLIIIEKKRVESNVRARIIIRDGDTRRDGYKYNTRTKKTIWFLCDQISFTYETKQAMRGKKAA